MVEWYYSYLGRRYLKVELHGEKTQLTTATGFPQGGVCSARFWLIAFDKAIRIINSRGVIGNGYADDCSALIGGTHSDNMIDKMQAVLDRLVTWGNSCGLCFNPAKTVVIMFPRSKKVFNRKVRMDGQIIPYSESVVYLGVTMDKELKWGHHINNKIAKAKRLLMKMSGIASAYWGPKPKLMRWAYTGIVRPMISYAALAWGHVLEESDHEDALRSLNRMAICTIVKVPRSTPTRAMEIIMDIMLLHLHIRKEGLRTYMRLHYELALNWEGVYQNITFSTSHRLFWTLLAQDTGVSAQKETDDCCVCRPDLHFTLDTSSFVNMDNSQKPANCNVYTDGSKMDGKVGAGVLILKDGSTIHETLVRLPDLSTVYQAEVLAIKVAANVLSTLPSLTSVKIYVDSQAALRTLQTDFVKSKTALQMILAMNEVRHDSLTFVWTKAHVGNEGNERADVLTKAGTKLTDITEVPLPSCEIKNVIDQGIQTISRQH